MDNSYLFTSESVTAGHPDKLCDMISDAVLDAYLKQDPYSRVACEVTATTGIINVMGEITSRAVVDIPAVVRATVKEAGYVGNQFGFDESTCGIILSIDHQSNDIDRGVSQPMEDNDIKEESDNTTGHGNDIGAGDQGMMFGYACQETANYMPAPIFYAHKLCERLSYVREECPFLGPDGKSMVTFRYKNEIPVSIDTIVVSVQHLSEISQKTIREAVKEKVILPVIPEHYLNRNTKLLINPTGRFVKGGPCADTGLTGRKIIVDTYGGVGRHGGGAFSGKDPTKVDRTGAYAARYVAKNIVAAKAARRCEVQIAYAIGVATPVSVHIDTFGTSGVENWVLEKMVSELFDLRLAVLIEEFDLRKSEYIKLAVYGHMGREDLGVAWEKTDKIDQIQTYLEKI